MLKKEHAAIAAEMSKFVTHDKYVVRVTARMVCKRLAQVMADHNSAFKKREFYKACGLTETGERK